MDDLISRQSIKKKLQEHHDFLVESNKGWITPSVITNARIDEISNCIAEIVNEPSVQPKQKWIPVSDRLPEEKQSVLVWCPEYKNMYCAYLDGNKNWWIFGAFAQIIPNAVIAWMPLPEPYKAESEEV